jgi:hypothetical protein
MRTATFDSGQKQVLELLLDTPFPSVSADDLVRLARLASFDSVRRDLLEMVRPWFSGHFELEDARRLVEQFAFSSGRLAVIEMYRDPLRRLPESDRARLISGFAMSSDAARAARLLRR